MTSASAAPIAYVLKRYPRLSETFITNEIRVIERLGTSLHIFSLLPPEPPPHHPMVADVAAPVHAIPGQWPEMVRTLLRAHGAVLRAAPWLYGRAAVRAIGWGLVSGRPVAAAKNFLRAGFVAARCREHGIRHIHAHFANAPAAVALLASLMTRLPFSLTAHAKDLYLSPKRVLRRNLEAATFIATCTEYNANYLREIAPARHRDRIHRIYHGIDLEMFAAPAVRAEPATNGESLILSVGRLVPKKGHDDLVAACVRLRAANEPFHCMIVGAGPEHAALEAEIAKAHLGEHVTLCGSMTHRELIELYRRADLFVLAPRIAEDGDRDGIPNVIAEAMAMCVPVVSTAVSGIPELVRHRETGELVAPHAPDELARAMLALLRDRPYAARLARAARERMHAEFDLWNTTRRLHDLLEGGTAVLMDANSEVLAASIAVAGE